MLEQDWIYGFLGGLLIGTGGAVFLLMNGRIMGASGILGGLLDGSGRANARERLAFLAGTILMPIPLYPFFRSVDTHITTDLTVIVLGGLMVGLGTRLANGCTSGHGVCGISRLSFRGISATAIYILMGGFTLSVLRHIWGVI
ncbi:hypothetical protein ATO10_10220 [Actibacterium atlanticum]|uniref:Uncharacterized protein n=1 Tax=Actibacterium atlanticum TaxID=1461693 RepID=A0A058ZJK0_9RHOB|nr:hypothetical protein ATO10_10220 [Actibacterium atlanticum]